MPTPTPPLTAIAGPAIDKIEAAVRSVQVPLDDIGMNLWAGLALIALIWQAGKWMLSEGDATAILGGLLRAIFLFSLTFWLLAPDSGGGNKIINFATSLVGDAAERIAGAGGLKAVVVGG